MDDSGYEMLTWISRTIHCISLALFVSRHLAIKNLASCVGTIEVQHVRPTWNTSTIGSVNAGLVSISEESHSDDDTCVSGAAAAKDYAGSQSSSICEVGDVNITSWPIHWVAKSNFHCRQVSVASRHSLRTSSDRTVRIYILYDRYIARSHGTEIHWAEVHAICCSSNRPQHHPTKQI